MSTALVQDRAPLPDWVVQLHPKPCRPRKRHACRVCGTGVLPGEECVRWVGVASGEGWWTCHAHPECYALTDDWDHDDWDFTDAERPDVRMYWPKDGKEEK